MVAVAQHTSSPPGDIDRAIRLLSYTRSQYADDDSPLDGVAGSSLTRWKLADAMVAVGVASLCGVIVAIVQAFSYSPDFYTTAYVPVFLFMSFSEMLALRQLLVMRAKGQLRDLLAAGHGAVDLYRCTWVAGYGWTYAGCLAAACAAYSLAGWALLLSLPDIVSCVLLCLIISIPFASTVRRMVRSKRPDRYKDFQASFDWWVAKTCFPRAREGKWASRTEDAILILATLGFALIPPWIALPLIIASSLVWLAATIWKRQSNRRRSADTAAEFAVELGAWV